MGKRKVISESEIERRLPNDEFEVLGRAEKLLGYDRIMVKCLDGVTRMCRIKGKMKRRAWIRVNDIVIVSPWDFQSDSRGDIVYRYKPNQLDWLRRNSVLGKDISFGPIQS
ncbi:translation initiation factor eIF-1A [Candidatus Bathyarchaeota archaeon]|nr:translation initiation factor eIF-1A [Candidatus Bathyarchaeota archaeon]